MTRSAQEKRPLRGVGPAMLSPGGLYISIDQNPAMSSNIHETVVTPPNLPSRM